MLRKSLSIVMLAMSLAGCAAMDGQGKGAASATPPEAFNHRIATSEVVLLWNCTRAASGLLQVEGVAQNPWQAQPVRYLEFELVGVDAQERTTAETSGTARDIQIYTNQSTPFQLALNPAGTEARFDLYYHYRFNEEFDTSALVAGPPMAAPRLFAQVQRFLVRDVCGDTQHLAR